MRFGRIGLGAAQSSVVLLLAVSGCGGSAPDDLRLSAGETAGPVPAHDPLRQTVEVAYLEPRTEIGIDVISGRLYEASERLGIIHDGRPWEHEALIGLEDPQDHNRIFRYVGGGIPGEPGWDPSWGKAAAPAPGALPQWVAPRLVSRAGHPVAVVLADGRRVGLDTDARGRVVGVHWRHHAAKRC